MTGNGIRGGAERASVYIFFRHNCAVQQRILNRIKALPEVRGK